MSLDILQQVFNPDDIARSFATMEPLKSFALDTFFKRKEIHSSPFISYSMVKKVLKTIPVVRRDGAPISLQNDGMDIDLFAPLPIKPSIDVLASELNDLKSLMGSKSALEAWRTSKIEDLRRVVRQTTEGMAATVAATGKISWELELKGGRKAIYEVDYGKIPEFDKTTKLSASSTIVDVYNTLKDMTRQINRNGYGGKTTYFAGEDVFSVLLMILENITTSSQQNSIRISFDAGKLNVGGYEIISLAEQYPAPNGDWVAKLGSKSLLAVSTDVDGYVYYCSLDSVSAKNQPLPFHIFPRLKGDDSGYELIAQSKPVPMRPSEASCIWSGAVA